MLAVTLEEAVTAAEERSSLVGMSEQQRVQAEAYQMRARFALLPSVWLDGSYTLNQREIVMDTTEWLPEEFSSYVPDDLEPTVIQEKEYFSASVRVDQAIFDARTLPGLRAANESLSASEARLERARRLLKAQVAQVAYQTQAAREATALAQRGVTMSEARLDLAEARKELGGAANREVLQAKLALSQALREQRGAQQAENDAELAFSQLTGFDRDVSLELRAQVTLPSSLSEALQSARDKRKDLEAARAMEASAFAVHQAARWSFMPRVNATFLTNYSENTMFSDYNTNWMGIVTAQWALWDGGILAPTRPATRPAGGWLRWPARTRWTRWSERLRAPGGRSSVPARRTSLSKKRCFWLVRTSVWPRRLWMEGERVGWRSSRLAWASRRPRWLS